MQIENDYDKEVYNGDIGYVVDDEIIATWTLAAEVGLQFRPMVVPILRDICEDLRAVDATRKARLCYDIYGSGKDPFSERMGW